MPARDKWTLPSERVFIAKANALGADLDELSISIRFTQTRNTWAWIKTPHASGYRFDSAEAAFNDLLRFLEQGKPTTSTEPLYPRR